MAEDGSVTALTLIWSKDFTVALDYGQFLLYTDVVEDFDLPVRVLERALEGEGIAQDRGLLVVCSPHQNNFDMALRVETWTSRPSDGLDEWPEACEAHLAVGSFGLSYESPTLNGRSVEVPTGEYHAEIAGRGFVSHGCPARPSPVTDGASASGQNRSGVQPAESRSGGSRRECRVVSVAVPAAHSSGAPRA
jgi:hypothetical protein